MAITLASNVQDLGTLKLFDQAEIGHTWHLSDSNVGATWETADFSAYVPKDANAIRFLVEALHIGAGAKAWILLTKRYSDLTNTNNINYWKLRFHAYSGTTNYCGGDWEIDIPVDDGKFKYRAYDGGSYLISVLTFQVRGYYL